MEQKQNGILQKLIKEIHKVCFIISFSVCLFCQGQENSIINKPFSLKDYSDKVSSNGTFTISQSQKLRKILNENSKYFIEKGWQKVEHSDNIITELIASDEFNLLKVKSNTKTRYLFITQNEILEDTLKINKGFDYSTCQLDKENKKHGIAIGKYKINGGNEFFEIHYLYQINDRGKIEKIKLSTTIFDCPAPTDYVKDEEPDSYKFGIVGGQKLTRYWFENSIN